MPFIGNAVLQGCDWVAFQCLWPCDYACAGKPCQFCFSGGQFEALAKRHKPMPFIPSPRDVSEVVLYAVEHDGVNSMQLTGGSTFKAETEENQDQSGSIQLRIHAGLSVGRVTFRRVARKQGEKIWKKRRTRP